MRLPTYLGMARLMMIEMHRNIGGAVSDRVSLSHQVL